MAVSHPKAEYMERAIALSRVAGIEKRSGRCFGAVVVDAEGNVIGEGANNVVSNSDPTGHGEILAIRDAAKKIGQSQLRGCVVYTSGEPCPMCMAACYWARIEKVFYASTIGDIKQYSGCDNQDLYAELMKPAAERKIPVAEFMREKAVEVWIEYSKMAEKCR